MESSSHQTASSATQSSHSEVKRIEFAGNPKFRGQFASFAAPEIPGSSIHTVVISAFYLCFDFRWCREKTRAVVEGLEPDQTRERPRPAAIVTKVAA